MTHELLRHRTAICRIVEQNGAMNPRVFDPDADSTYTCLIIDPIDSHATQASGARIKHELQAVTGFEIDVVILMDLPERCRRAVLAGSVPV